MPTEQEISTSPYNEKLQRPTGSATSRDTTTSASTNETSSVRAKSATANKKAGKQTQKQVERRERKLISKTLQRQLEDYINKSRREQQFSTNGTVTTTNRMEPFDLAYRIIERDYMEKTSPRNPKSSHGTNRHKSRIEPRVDTSSRRVAQYTEVDRLVEHANELFSSLPIDKLALLHGYRPHPRECNSRCAKVQGYSHTVGAALHAHKYVDFYLNTDLNTGKPTCNRLKSLPKKKPQDTNDSTTEKTTTMNKRNGNANKQTEPVLPPINESTSTPKSMNSKKSRKRTVKAAPRKTEKSNNKATMQSRSSTLHRPKSKDTAPLKRSNDKEYESEMWIIIPKQQSRRFESEFQIWQNLIEDYSPREYRSRYKKGVAYEDIVNDNIARYTDGDVMNGKRLENNIYSSDSNESDDENKANSDTEPESTHSQSSYRSNNSESDGSETPPSDSEVCETASESDNESLSQSDDDTGSKRTSNDVSANASMNNQPIIPDPSSPIQYYELNGRNSNDEKETREMNEVNDENEFAEDSEVSQSNNYDCVHCDEEYSPTPVTTRDDASKTGNEDFKEEKDMNKQASIEEVRQAEPANDKDEQAELPAKNNSDDVIASAKDDDVDTQVAHTSPVSCSDSISRATKESKIDPPHVQRITPVIVQIGGSSQQDRPTSQNSDHGSTVTANSSDEVSSTTYTSDSENDSTSSEMSTEKEEEDDFYETKRQSSF